MASSSRNSSSYSYSYYDDKTRSSSASSSRKNRHNFRQKQSVTNSDGADFQDDFDEFTDQQTIDDTDVEEYDNSYIGISIFCLIVNPIFGIPALILALRGKNAYQEHRWASFERLTTGVHVLTCIGFFLTSGLAAMGAIKAYHVYSKTACVDNCSFLTNPKYDFFAWLNQQSGRYGNTEQQLRQQIFGQQDSQQ